MPFNSCQTQRDLTADRHHLAVRLALDQRHDPPRHRLHDALVFDRIAVAIAASPLTVEKVAAKDSQTSPNKLNLRAI
jgi:hypothetical protein